jgi:hypothetical protein
MELTFDAESIRPIKNILAIGSGKIAFCKTEVIDRIQEICFPYSVWATNARNPGIEIKPRLRVILKLVQ